MLEIVIQGLNMKAVNALIWSSSVLAKIGIATALIVGILYGLLALVSLLWD